LRIVGDQLAASAAAGVGAVRRERGQLRAPVLDAAVRQRRPLRRRPRVLLLRVSQGLQGRPLRHPGLQGGRRVGHRGAAQRAGAPVLGTLLPPLHRPGDHQEVRSEMTNYPSTMDFLQFKLALL